MKDKASLWRKGSLAARVASVAARVQHAFFGFLDRDLLASAGCLSSHREGACLEGSRRERNLSWREWCSAGKAYFGRDLLASAENNFSQREVVLVREGRGASC